MEKAHNGSEGLTAALTNAYDLVLMDIQMPIMGHRSHGKYPQEEKPKELPIIAMTAHAMTGDREKSLAAGMQEHVTKPSTRPNSSRPWPNGLNPAKGSCPKTRQLSPTPNPHRKPTCPTPCPGIDMKQGLRRISNNKGLYLSLLLKLKTRYPDTAKTIQTLMNEAKPRTPTAWPTPSKAWPATWGPSHCRPLPSPGTGH